MLSRQQPGDGFFSTRGNEIVDAAGIPVRLSAVNWFGMETVRGAPDGLQARNWQEMMDQMKALGFNAIRLPFSSEVLDGRLPPTDIDYGRNPDLAGLSGVQLLDRIVGYAGEIGLRIILDRHRGTAGDGPNGSGLWYDNTHPEAEWIADWVMLAGRYRGNPTVIGADLHNEPHSQASWGGDPATDWHAAAERAGAAIQAVNPDWLILVEGVDRHEGDSYWWGGNLQGVAERPVVLPAGNKVVYSPHDYPNSVFAQPWFQSDDLAATLPAVFDRQWGYISREGIAPIILGEFGSRLQDPKDLAWLLALTRTLNGDHDGDGTRDAGAPSAGLSWAWWSWNPNSGDTGGILGDNWITPDQGKLDILAFIPGTDFAASRLLVAPPQGGDLHGGAGLDTLRIDQGSGAWHVLRDGESLLARNLGTGATLSGAAIEVVQFADGVRIDLRALSSERPLEYVASHADLAAAFGADALAGSVHRLQHGFAEGRATSFDGLAYIASQADLIAAFGASEDAGATHYIRHGRAEGRATSFDPASYLAAHEDLLDAFWQDTEAAAAHYIRFGRNEGRATGFDAARYIAGHDDLVDAFGTDLRAGTRHWLAHGHAEGRDAAAFDAAQYLRNYADLRAAFGADEQAAALHYITHGHAEQRSDAPLG
ncbi:glycoside hydrolase family 5 protein [Teichococcus aestuarii]|uniref:cellulase n=1 Tax=Teichococcus aestuarii TaxID=568898 RepID=A0A2U1V518_9PROT|nr:glycoside hydrolase family 5 protein [Pseudoroseomonas aestuarii]PWC28984.1 hypothetical protein CR165_10335 [Pseudoroseomonas aestuarii]